MAQGKDGMGLLSFASCLDVYLYHWYNGIRVLAWQKPGQYPGSTGRLSLLDKCNQESKGVMTSP